MIRPSTLDTADTNANFEAWFATSRAVDANGAPQVVFHGTVNNDIFVFKSSENGTYGDGMYFSSDPNIASFWAGDREADGFDFEPGGSVYPVVLRILNPAGELLASQLESVHGSRTSLELQRLGYDGVIADDGEMVVFSPCQIKSVICNTGQYRLECDDITDGHQTLNANLISTAEKASLYIKNTESRSKVLKPHG